LTLSKCLCVTRFRGTIVTVLGLVGSLSRAARVDLCLLSSCNGDKAPEDPCIEQCGEVNSDSFQRALRCRPPERACLDEQSGFERAAGHDCRNRLDSLRNAADNLLGISVPSSISLKQRSRRARAKCDV